MKTGPTPECRGREKGGSWSESVRAQPLSLRISVTDRCQLRCMYCMPADGVSKLRRDQILSFEEIVRFVHALKSRFEVSKVRITGGDPLIEVIKRDERCSIPSASGSLTQAVDTITRDLTSGSFS